MTLGELMESLQDLHEAGAELDQPVRLAFQPEWPLRFSVDQVKVLIEEGEGGRDEAIVWIAASYGHPWNENPYAPKAAWDEE